MARIHRRLAVMGPYLALLAGVLAFYRKALFAPGFLIPWDLVWYNLPLATYISKCLGRGEFPLWDPYTYCGFPFFANLQAQLWYPPTILAIAASGFATGTALLLALEWQIAAHLWLGGVGTYWLLRRLGAGRPAATLGGIVFELGPYFASVSALGAPNTAAWLPLAWLAVVALREGFRWRWLALLALSFGMAILAGFPATTAVVFGSTFLLALAFVIVERRSPALLAAVAAASLWSGLLAAVQLLPTLELMSLGSSLERGAYSLGGSPLQSLVTMVSPNHYHELDMKGYTLPGNPAFVYLYCGIPGLVLALAAVAFRRNRLTAVFLFLTAASLVWMLGKSTPVGPIVWSMLPGPVKAPLYVEFTKAAFVLGLAVLAGLGAESFALLKRRYVAMALVLIAAVNLIAVGSGQALNTGKASDHPLVTPEEFEGTPETPAKLHKLINRRVPPWRIEAVRDSRAWASSAAVAEIPTPHGNEPLFLSRVLAVRRIFCESPWWERYCEASALNSPVLDLLNVRYVVAWEPEDPPEVRKAGLRRVEQTPGHFVYEKPNALPRFFLVNRIRASKSLAESVAALRAADFDPRHVAIVEGLRDWAGVDGPAPPLEAVKVREYDMRSVRLRVDSPGQGFLVTSEAHYPGWKAYVDGREQPLYMTNGAFRGLAVPAGRHTVEMRFEPAVLWYGLAISAIAWCGLIAALLRRPFTEPG